MSGADSTSARGPSDAPRRGRYSANLGLIGIVVVVMGGAMLIAAGLQLGAAAIIAGFTAIFFTIGIGGGALRADLRKAAWYGPLTALSASVPRLLADDDPWLGLALVCVIIFVAGLLPVLGSNYAQAGMGLGIATLLGFAVQTPTGSPGQTVAAAFVGVAFVVLLRVLLKIRDPSDVTRDTVAATLTQDDPDFGAAYAMWLRDKPAQWLGDCLYAAVGYRILRPALSPGEAKLAEEHASRSAGLVTAHRPAPAAEHPEGDDEPPPPDDRSDTLRHTVQALHYVDKAARQRDAAEVPGAVRARRAFTLACLRSVATWRSEILRHAVRTSLGVLLTFIVAWALVGSHDPLVTSMATAAFAILQTSWTQSFHKARQRLLAVAGGAAVVALALWLLPPQWLLLLAVLAAATGLWFIAGNQVLSLGSFVIVSVGMNSAGHHLDPVRTLLEYVILLLIAVAIGLVLGFLVVPHVKPSRIDQRVSRARDTAAELLRRAGQPRTTPAPHRDALPHTALRALHHALTEARNLRSPECASLKWPHLEA